MSYFHSRYNILIVDDYQLIIDGLMGILKGEKSIGSVLFANNGQEAIEKVMKNDIDCVLMDINMPLLNGYEATKIIKQQKPQVKVVIYSMFSDASTVVKSKKAGADAFIIKDTGRDELVNTIESVIQNKKYTGSGLNPGITGYVNPYNQLTTAGLTPREIEIIRYLAAGISNREIAEKLFLSLRTIDTHQKNILAKLSLKNTAALIKYATENNLL